MARFFHFGFRFSIFGLLANASDLKADYILANPPFNMSDRCVTVNAGSIVDAAVLLKRMAGRQVQLPDNRDFWPDKTHLVWHREHKLSGGNQ